MAGKTSIFCVSLMTVIFPPIIALCPYTCRTFPTPMKYMELKCNKTDDVMFHVDMKSSPDTPFDCRGTPDCVGVQEHVLTATNEDCYWNCSCHVPLDSSYPMILNREGMCLAEFPSLFSWTGTCINNKAVYNFYKVKRGQIKRRKKSKFGVVKIGDQYPWHYPINITRHIITFKKSRRRKLLISFLDVDVDYSTDNLSLSSSSQNVIVTERSKNETFDFTNQNVRLELAIGSSSRSGRGFVLCFKWVGVNSRSRGHTCDQLEGVSCAVASTVDRPQASTCSTSRRRGKKKKKDRRRRPRTS